MSADIVTALVEAGDWRRNRPLHERAAEQFALDEHTSGMLWNSEFKLREQLRDKNLTDAQRDIRRLHLALVRDARQSNLDWYHELCEYFKRQDKRFAWVIE